MTRGSGDSERAVNEAFPLPRLRALACKVRVELSLDQEPANLFRKGPGKCFRLDGSHGLCRNDSALQLSHKTAWTMHGCVPTKPDL